MSNWVLRYAGLARPYRFDRLLCMLVSAGALLVLSALCAVLLRADRRADPLHAARQLFRLSDDIGAGGRRAGALAAAGGAGAGARGDRSVARRGIAGAQEVRTGLQFDHAATTTTMDPRFEWHPLLQAVPIPSISVDVVGNRDQPQQRRHARPRLHRRGAVAEIGRGRVRRLGDLRHRGRRRATPGSTGWSRRSARRVRRHQSRRARLLDGRARRSRRRSTPTLRHQADLRALLHRLERHPQRAHQGPRSRLCALSSAHHGRRPAGAPLRRRLSLDLAAVHRGGAAGQPGDGDHPSARAARRAEVGRRSGARDRCIGATRGRSR